MYYLVTWKDWKSNQEMSIRLDPKDVTRFVAILVSSIKPDSIVITKTD